MFPQNVFILRLFKFQRHKINCLMQHCRKNHNYVANVIFTNTNTNIKFRLLNLLNSPLNGRFSEICLNSVRKVSTSKFNFTDSSNKDPPVIPYDKDTKASSVSNKIPTNQKQVDDPSKKQPLKDKPLTAIKIKTIDGKLIVTTAPEGETPQSHATESTEPEASQRSQSLEINTKKGKLVVTTTTSGEDKKPQNVVLERLKKDPPIAGPNSGMDAKVASVVAAIDDIKAVNAAKAMSTAKPKRERLDFNRSSLERNFITPARAMSDFLLKLADLESLPKTKRRSPYEQEPPIVVYWRKDVEAKAIEVWGSRENLLRECLNREIERKRHQQNIFTVKRRLRDYRREMGSKPTIGFETGLKGRSGRVIVTAIIINATNFIFKVCAWLYTGSHSMFAESIHSLADTTNQIILAYGIHKSTQTADPDHPYGYANMKYVSSLISGVGIFCVGTGLSFYHGILGIMNPAPVDDFFWAFCILGGSLISEGATLLVAINSLRHSAKLAKTSFREFVVRGQDPSVNVVLFEDAAAVASVMLAAGCMGLSLYTGSSIPDACGSLLVGCMLGIVASCIITTNVQALVGRSIPGEQLDQINSELEKDIMIRAIHDVKGIDMGNSLVRYKAEMDFDGRELTRFYLEKQDLNELLEEVKSFNTVDELEAFMLKHGENIVDLMGGEIDRIEMKLRKKFPEIRHCDLEIL